MRKFSSTDDSINQSSPTSSYHYPVYSQLDKNGKNRFLVSTSADTKFSLCYLLLDYVMEDYYSPNRSNITTTNVNYNNNVITNKTNIVTSNEIHAPVKVVRKRTTANKKERRRTQSINSAYSSLREHIPNVPSDTKLSKVYEHN